MEKEIICPLCGEKMYYDRKFDFHKCFGCSCEVWPPEKKKGRRKKAPQFKA
jgi:hypothetical protein